MGPMSALLGSLFRTRAPLRAAAGRAGTAAARSVRARAIAEADELGLTGSERSAYKASREGAASAARSHTVSGYEELLGGVGAPSRLPAALGRRLRPMVESGDLEGAARALESAVKRAVTREAYDIRKGRRSTTPTELRFAGSTPEVVSEVLSRVEAGASLQEAARGSLGRFAVVRRGARDDIVGEEAMAVATRAKEINDSYAEAFGAPDRSPRSQERIMGKYFDRQEDGTWLDAEGREWTVDDLRSYASKSLYEEDEDGNKRVWDEAIDVDPGSILTPDAMEYLNRRTFTPDPGARYDLMVSNFGQSLRSAGMDTGSPKLYAAIMGAVGRMSPGRFLGLVRKGAIRKHLVWFFSSDQGIISARVRELLDDLGIKVWDDGGKNDGSKIYSEDLTW